MMQPTLIGPSVRLRPLEPGDFDSLYAVASDPEIWAQHPARNRYQPDVFRRYFDDGLASGGALLILDARGEALGASRYSADPAAPGRVEIGSTFLSRRAWGGTINREVKTLMLRHAFQVVDTVFFRIGENNLRSRRAMEKIGGQLADQTEVVPGLDGGPVVHVIYEIHRDRYLDVGAKAD